MKKPTLGPAYLQSEGSTKKTPMPATWVDAKDLVPLEVGVKYDLEKPDYSLIPPKALDDVVKVLTLGAQKYSRDNWKMLKNARIRYFAAAMRHLWARFRGQIYDDESGLDHGAHAVCCILFMMEMTNENIDP